MTSAALSHRLTAFSTVLSCALHSLLLSASRSAQSCVVCEAKAWFGFSKLGFESGESGEGFLRLERMAGLGLVASIFSCMECRMECDRVIVV